MSKSVTAKDVRAFLNADPKRTAGLSEAALHTLRPGARGSVHPEAVARHNSRRRTVQYTEGNSKAAKAADAAQRDALRASGVAVGKRGPLSKAAKAALKQSKG